MFLPASSCWEAHEAHLHPALCCLGTQWGFDAHMVEQCWTEGRSYQNCCLSERILSSQEIWLWQNGKLSCGCDIKELGNDAFCRLRTKLTPKDEANCMTYSYTYVVELIKEFGRRMRALAGAMQYPRNDLHRCPPGVFILMVSDLVAHLGQTDVRQRPSFHYLNHVLPYALEATHRLARRGWNLLAIWKSVKATATIQRYDLRANLQGLGSFQPAACDVSLSAVALMGDLRRVVAEQVEVEGKSLGPGPDKDIKGLHAIHRAQRSRWREESETCMGQCCMIPASVRMAGLPTKWNQARFDFALQMISRAANGNWLHLLLWNPWPVVDVLETFLPFPQRVSQLVTIQPLEKAERCFKGQDDVPSVTTTATTTGACQGKGVARIVLRGRSFVWRRGDMKTEGQVGLPESLPEQLLAARSHVLHVAKPLEEFGYEVQVLGVTYDTPYLQLLEAAYRPYLLEKFTLLPPPGSQTEGLERAVELLMEDPPSCSGPVVLLRFDLILKRSLGPFLQRAWQRGQEFLAPFWCEATSLSREITGGGLCVSDVLQVFPGSAVHQLQRVLKEDGGWNHSGHFHHWLSSIIHLGETLPSKAGVLIPDRFVTNPGAEWNPLYDFANREAKAPTEAQRQSNWTLDLRRG